MARAGEDAVDRPVLDDAAGVHHDHAVGELGHHAKVVGDEEDGDPALAAQVVDQGEDAVRRRRVERAGRLVGDQQLGLGTDDRRDQRPLRHASGQLVPALADPHLGVVDLHLADQLEHARLRLRPAHPLVQPQRLGDLPADRLQRVERPDGILEDEPHPAAAHAGEPRLVEPDQLVALEADRPAHDARARHEAHERHRGHRLARARLADDRHALSGPDLEGDAVDRGDAPAELDAQVRHGEQRRGHQTSTVTVSPSSTTTS
jgi:hypothetical protein